MAEPVSSIITIATLGLAIIKGCANYIESVREVDALVDRLLEEVTRLHEMVRYIKSTYHKVGLDERSEPSVLVRDKINLCRTRLREIKPKVVYLASQSSDTVMEKTMLKMKVDQVTKDIELAVQDINNYMADINTLFNCWRFEVAHLTHRDPRVSEAEQFPLDPRQHRAISISNSSSVAEDDLSVLRTNSTTQSEAYRPILRPSRSPFDDNGSISSAPSSTTSKRWEDWQSFHFKILKCMDDESRVEEIRSILEQSSDPAALANIPGECRRVPLHIAAQRGLIWVARVLVEFGADINAKDTEPSTVLDHAVANKQREFVAFLLANHVDETAILERNRFALMETKNIIGLQSARRDSASSRESRRFSFSFRKRQQST
ncbi:uncharacterized protein yc1106_02277 [Curvularia clavata]|uniref:Ankyrin repeat protein n=1 Tax=Curvularia clavata TaxID=95742 RepID=A0A9Q8Z6W6_CURCL|nr:uncharacterized protein yc1106_02277 [Curvularia clavata]